MSWAITPLEVRRLANEPEAALSLPSDLAMLTEDTYVRYTCYKYYTQGKDLLLTSAPAFSTGNAYAAGEIVAHKGGFFEATILLDGIGSSQPQTGCDNEPTITAIADNGGVVFETDLTNVTDPNADVFIYTRKDSESQWAAWLGASIRFEGEVRFEVLYHNGCPPTIEKYAFDLQGNLTLIVSNIGEVHAPLIGGSLHVPYQSESWRPILFDTSIEKGKAYQEVYDMGMGPIVAYRSMRAALPKAKAPIQGGQFKRAGGLAGDAPTKHDFDIRLSHIDNMVSMYVARLERHAKQNELHDWSVCPDNSSCSSSTNTGRRRSPLIL